MKYYLFFKSHVIHSQASLRENIQFLHIRKKETLMNNKWYALSLLSFAMMSLNGTEKLSQEQIDQMLAKTTPQQLLAEANKRDLNGNTPLHLVVLSPQERDANYPLLAHLLTTEQRREANYDTEQALMAARLILNMKADVSIKNTRGVSPYDVAKEQKSRFPTIWQVLKAGKAVQRPVPCIPGSKPGRELESLAALGQDGTLFRDGEIYALEYVQGLETLSRYAANPTRSAEKKRSNLHLVE